MVESLDTSWEKRVVSPDKILEKIKPGNTIFLGTGMAEPRTLVKRLMTTKSKNLHDLELIQLGSFGDVISMTGPISRKYRLKTSCCYAYCKSDTN